jgi:hypothetical protein
MRQVFRQMRVGNFPRCAENEIDLHIEEISVGKARSGWVDCFLIARVIAGFVAGSIATRWPPRNATHFYLCQWHRADMIPERVDKYGHTASVFVRGVAQRQLVSDDHQPNLWRAGCVPH